MPYDEFFSEMYPEIHKRMIDELSPFWSINDDCHDESHFREVERCGNVIINTLFDRNEHYKYLMVYFAYIHDLFAWSRKNHHELSALWVRTTDFKIITEHLNEKEIDLLSRACQEHRASRRDEFTDIFCEIACSADREIPNLTRIIKRSMGFYERKGLSEKEQYISAVLHIKDKFGRNGYARYPDMYKQVFKDELEKLWDDIDSLKV